MNGLIGFFDILGYQNFLKNNSATDSALEVLELITNIPTEIREFMSGVVNDSRPQDKEYRDALSHLVFSDTIVFALPYPENATDEWKINAATFLSIGSAMLAAEMFLKGLPIRGAICEGNFIFKDTCMAGTVIVDAYHLCESLDFAGIALSKELGLREHTDNDGKYSFTYLTPLKDGKEEKFINLNWMTYVGDDVLSKCSMDVEKFVLDAFWAHQKDCSISVDSKVRNTVKVIRKMLQNIEIHTKDKAENK